MVLQISLKGMGLTKAFRGFWIQSNFSNLKDHFLEKNLKVVYFGLWKQILNFIFKKSNRSFLRIYTFLMSIVPFWYKTLMVACRINSGFHYTCMCMKSKYTYRCLQILYKQFWASKLFRISGYHWNRHYMAEILPIRRKTLSNQSIPFKIIKACAFQWNIIFCIFEPLSNISLRSCAVIIMSCS